MWKRIRNLAMFGATLSGIVSNASLGHAEDNGDGASITAPSVSRESELAAAAIHLPAGFRAKCVASEPLLGNPVAFCFDERGRMLVAETHREKKGVEDNRAHPDWVDEDLAASTVEQRRDFMVRHANGQTAPYTEQSDVVRMLEDEDHDGRYEKSTVFSTGYNNVEDGAAAGVMWDRGRLLLTCIPSLWELRDTDGDGRAEHKQRLASGFGVHCAFFGHDLHGLTHGPDGKIYFSVGDRGLNVKTADGRVVSNPDSGAILRCNPDGSDLEIVATGFRNPQELAFNEYGDLFTVDNNSDGGDKARLVHVIEGMDAGWRMYYQYLPDRGPFFRESIWQLQSAEQPASIVPPLAHISSGPAGLVHYPGTGFPAIHDGAFFSCDFTASAGSSGVREFWVERSGSTYRLSHQKMFAEGVLATDCEFGPEGGLYITDWIDGWNYTGKGRIHRVTCNDEHASAEGRETWEHLKSIATADTASLSAALGHKDMRLRLAAQQRLVDAGNDSIPLLIRIATDTRGPELPRLHAIWSLGELSDRDPAVLHTLMTLTGDSDAEIRAQVAKTLSCGATAASPLRREIGSALVPLLADTSLRVRVFAALTMGKLQHREALKALLKLVRDDENDDPTLRHAAAVGLAGSQPPDALAAAVRGASDAERLVIVVALSRQRSPLVAELLADNSKHVRTEAARAIWNVPIVPAYPQLAATLEAVASDNEPMLRRSLAACNAEGTTDRLEAVIDCGLRKSLNDSMREHLWDLVLHWEKPNSRDPVLGSWRPLSPRSHDKLFDAVRAKLPAIVASGEAGRIGLIVACELRVDEAFAPLQKVVVDHSLSPDLQRRAFAALSSADESLVEDTIKDGLASTEPLVRTAARELLARRFPERAVDPLDKVVDSATAPERQAAILMLGNLDTPAARRVIAQWMNRVEQKQCPPELQLDVLEAASQSKDQSLAERSKSYTERLASSDPTTRFSTSLSGGDVDQGRRIFQTNTALSCQRCHSFNPGEKRVGPNLADVGSRLSRNQILESIVSPNAKIADGFHTTVLQLDTGKIVSGIIQSEDKDRVVLAGEDDKTIMVEAATIEGRIEGRSAMPDDLVNRMTPRELRDLVEFLSQLHSPMASDHAK